jgi:hypothetical protein
MTTFKKALLSFTVACGVAVSAQAAEINVCRACNTDTGYAMLVKGDLVDGDAAKFEATIGMIPRDKPSTVFLESNGGKLVEGIRIGAAIRLAGARTVVVTYCYSACATAWLGGTHAAYGADKRAVGPGNAAMGFYVASLGLGLDVAAWTTAVGADQINLVTPEVAKRLHLPTQFLPPLSRH